MDQPTKPERDRKREEHEGDKNFALKLGELRALRERGQLSDEMLLVAQALVLCGLPYEPTDKTRIIRKVRLGDGSFLTVVFSAALESKMPYGSDRTLLYWMVDKAIKQQTPFVTWKKATEFLKDLGLTDSGKNRNDLKERFKRLSGLTIGITRRNGDSSVLIPLIEEKHLPSSVDVKNEKDGKQLLPLDTIPFGFKLSDRLFQDILSHNVPIPLKLLQSTRKQSRMQDLMIFLYWRSFAAQSETLISWPLLDEQLAHDDSNKSRIKGQLAKAIAALRIMWPELRAEARKTGLWIAPPTNGKQFIPALNNMRRLQAPLDPTRDKNTIDALPNGTTNVAVSHEQNGENVVTKRDSHTKKNRTSE